MTPRLWALSLAPVLAATSAHAQAPGEVAPAGPAPAPYHAPPAGPYAPAGGPYAGPYAPAVPAPPARPSVMAHRFAIGLSLGGSGVAPEGAADGMDTQFRVAELALRYRATRSLEIELAMSGGREVMDDDVDGDLAMGSVTLALRYRFRAEHRWNWFVMGGLGGTVIASHQSTEAEREGATRPLGMLGIGVERRFRRLALQAELRTVGLGEREDSAGDAPIVDDGAPRPGAPLPPPRLPGNAATTHAESLAGGMFTLGASVYF